MDKQHDFDQSVVFENEILPLLKEASDLCEKHGIPFTAMASVARLDNFFRLFSLAQGNPKRTPERMIAANSVAIPVIAAQLTNVAGMIAARFLQHVKEKEEGHDPELAEMMRIFSAVSRMGVTSHLIMRHDTEGMRMLDLTPDQTSPHFGVDKIAGIDQVIRTVFTAHDEDENEDDANGVSGNDDLVSVDELPEQFRDFFRKLFGEQGQ